MDGRKHLGWVDLEWMEASRMDERILDGLVGWQVYWSMNTMVKNDLLSWFINESTRRILAVNK